MTPLPPSAFITESEVPEILKSTLVLCPVYDRPEIQTEDLLANLELLGAEVAVSRGVSDVALHRCLSAATAYEKCFGPDHARRFETIFWLDGDMVGTPAHVAALCKLALEHDTSVCAMACPRLNTKSIAAKRLVGDAIQHALLDDPRSRNPQYFTSQYLDCKTTELIPVYAGLACLATPVDRIKDVFAACDWFDLQGRAIPAVCQSKALKMGSQTIWLSEDMYHSQLLWEHGNGLYLAPLTFGHLTRGVVYPDPDARFLAEAALGSTTPP